MKVKLVKVSQSKKYPYDFLYRAVLFDPSLGSAHLSCQHQTELTQYCYDTFDANDYRISNTHVWYDFRNIEDRSRFIKDHRWQYSLTNYSNRRLLKTHPYTATTINALYHDACNWLDNLHPLPTNRRLSNWYYTFDEQDREYGTHFSQQLARFNFRNEKDRNWFVLRWS